MADKEARDRAIDSAARIVRSDTTGFVSRPMPDDLATYEWRTGGHGSCGIFAIGGCGDTDMILGLMTTPRLAAAVVEQHNAAIRGREDALARSLYPSQAARDALAPNQDAEDVEPRLAPPSIAGEESRS